MLSVPLLPPPRQIILPSVPCRLVEHEVPMAELDVRSFLEYPYVNKVLFAIGTLLGLHRPDTYQLHPLLYIAPPCPLQGLFQINLVA